ncbi:Synaptotagmin-1 [Hondaea fermentalgiana]|uniref:Synaptotagmin-1 n=1 Tax=Hondaea fermentalgiana TaxID=2315210 RepID=A0A2R5G3S8_9STRA|nr:Synaptotagmin-1 [Hondaea fermentalgiana]|eukprot:GBG24408.1 Synaptotagmin-1 [Hondaea fermentalgiana]
MLRKLSPLRRRESDTLEDADTGESARHGFFRSLTKNTNLDLLSNKDKTTEPEQKNETFQARVEILRAEGLRIADKKAKSSDPFVEISLAGKKRKTSVRSRTLNPVWEEEFAFGTSARRRLHGDEQILFHLLDKDFVFNDDLGACVLDLSSVLKAPERTLTTWLQLEPLETVEAANSRSRSPKKRRGAASANATLGRLQVCVSLESSEAKALEEIPQGKETAETDAADEEVKEDDTLPVDADETEPADITHAQSTSVGSNLDELDGSLRVTIHCARDLMAADRNGKSDPYCMVYFGKKKFTTKTVKRSLDPEWAETFEFDFAKNKKRAPLTLKVYDADFIGDDCLGKVVIPFAEVFAQATGDRQDGQVPIWYQLDSGKGEIQVSLDVVGQENETNSLEAAHGRAANRGLLGGLRSLSPRSLTRRMLDASSPRSLTSGSLQARKASSSAQGSDSRGTVPDSPQPFELKVIRAKGLRSADKNGLSDPFCKVQLLRERHRTRKIRKSLEPEWNETFSFSRATHWEWQSSLTVFVADADMLGTSDFLGQAEVTLETLYEARGAPIWLDLRPKGSYSSERPDAVNSNDENDTELGSIQIAATFEEQKDELAPPSASEGICVRVFRAKELPATDRGASCDPYCVISYKTRNGKSRKVKTSVIKNSREPSWEDDERASFQLKDADAEAEESSLQVKVLDKDLFGRNLVGHLELNVQAALAQREASWYSLAPKGGKILLSVTRIGKSDDAENQGATSNAETSALAVFDDVILHMQRQLRKHCGTIEKLQTAFEMNDTNHSGFIDREELAHLLQHFGISKGLRDGDEDTLLDALDTNGDGQIDFEELRALLDDLDSPGSPGSPESPFSPQSAASKLQRSESGLKEELQDVLAAIVGNAIHTRRRLSQGVSEADLVDDFVCELRQNFELVDDENTGTLKGEAKLTNVLALTRVALRSGHDDAQVLFQAFRPETAGPRSGKVLSYYRLCEAILACAAASQEAQHGAKGALEEHADNEDKGIPADIGRRNDAVVFVHVLCAENLPRADRVSGKADPFVVVKLGSRSQKTSVVKRTLNPSWNDETFEFPCVRGGKSEFGPEDEIIVQVKDKDMLFSELLGTLTIPLARVSHNEESAAWYNLELPRGRRKELGKAIKQPRVQLLVSIEGVYEQLPAPQTSGLSPPIASVDEYREGMQFSPAGSLASEDQTSLASPRSGYGSDQSIASDQTRWHDRQLREIRNLVARALRDGGRKQSLRAEFERLDVRQRGYLSSRRLLAGLAASGIHLTPAQLAVVLPRIDPEGKDRADYSLFCKIVRADTVSSTQRTSSAFVENTRSRLSQVLARAHARKTKFATLFLAFDTSQSGLMSEQDCRSALKALDAFFEPNELSTLAQRIPGAEQNGYIAYEKLLAAVCPSIDVAELFLDARTAYSVQRGPSGSRGDQESVYSSLTRLKRASRMLAQSKSGFDLARALEKLDVAGDGKISRRVFRKFLLSELTPTPGITAGDQLSEVDAQALVDHFDPRDTGMIDYTEVYKACAMTKDELSAVIERFRDALQSQHRLRSSSGAPSLLTAFSRADREGTGRISRREFRQVLETMSGDLPITLSSEEMRFLMDKFDANCSGMISFHDFVHYVHEGVPPSLGAADQGEVDLYHVDKLMRAEKSEGPQYRATFAAGTGASGGALRDAANASPLRPHGVIGGLLETANGAAESSALPVADLWHPHTISEWLERHATSAERSDFDELYRSISKFEHRPVGASIGLYGGEASLRSPVRGRSPVRYDVRSGASYVQVRSPSPMDRASNRVGWRCTACKHVNHGLQSLNTCARCGGIRATSARVVIRHDHSDSEDDDEGSVSDRSAFSSDSEESPRREDTVKLEETS